MQVIDTETGQKSCEVKSIKTELSIEASKNMSKKQSNLTRQLSGGNKTSDGEFFLAQIDFEHYNQIYSTTALCPVRKIKLRSDI